MESTMICLRDLVAGLSMRDTVPHVATMRCGCDSKGHQLCSARSAYMDLA